MRINDSARIHGVSDEDMLHAARMVLRTIAEQDGGRTLIIGTGTSGQLLEVVIKDAGDETEPEIIHAMALRKNFYRYL
jgi:hypothetical protein